MTCSVHVCYCCIPLLMFETLQNQTSCFQFFRYFMLLIILFYSNFKLSANRQNTKLLTSPRTNHSLLINIDPIYWRDVVLPYPVSAWIKVLICIVFSSILTFSMNSPSELTGGPFSELKCSKTCTSTKATSVLSTRIGSDLALKSTFSLINRLRGRYLSLENLRILNGKCWIWNVRVFILK